MTNARIIFEESQRLMEEGTLKGTGRFITVEFEDGTTATVEEPEEIHTFNGWKERGYSVKRRKEQHQVCYMEVHRKEEARRRKDRQPHRGRTRNAYVYENVGILYPRPSRAYQIHP